MSDACGTCLNVIAKNSYAVICQSCKIWYHIKCVNMSVNRLNAIHKELKNPNGERFYCDACKQSDAGTSASQSSIANPSKNYTINDIMEKLINMENQYADLLKKYDTQLKVNEELKSEITAIKLQVTELQNKPTVNHDIQLDINEQIREINDRQSRQKNLMIFGVPETDENDQELVQEMFTNHCPDVNTHGLKTFRISHVTPNKIRPLKVILSSSAEVSKVIKQAKVIKLMDKYRNFSFSFDRTRKQIDEYKMLKATLIQRSLKGEKNLRIRYFQGTPKIVTDNLNGVACLTVNNR